MQDIINWFNENQGFVGSMISILAMIISIIFGVISAIKSKKAKESEKSARESLQSANEVENRIALFEKRLHVYTRIKEFVALVISNNSCSYEDVTNFIRDCRDANWLFNNDITDYIKVISDKGRRLAYLNKVEDSATKDRNNIIDEEFIIMDWFTEQFSIIGQFFDKYLNINEIGLNKIAE